MKHPLLSTIHSPRDLDDLSFEELLSLCDEIRDTIIQTLSKKGGHLGSNLGIVELTVALHRVFRAPEDKFVFDVSHQTYPHKLLTGRYGRFGTIGEIDGLCGFSNPDESGFDHFHAGHAGTALSLGLGMAATRKLRGREEEHIIPIIGDATLTCGLSLEALNNIPEDLSRFLVILNDNNMSISENVGAITNILSRFVNSPTLNRVYREIGALLSKIGEAVAKQGSRIKESIKTLVSCAPFFEEFGLTYVGPIDGHDLGKLIDVLEALKNEPKPTILHVLTTKGKGLQTAIDNPATYHGCSPFDPETGELLPAKSKETFPKLFGKYITEKAKEDPSIFAVTPAMPLGSCITPFLEKEPGRCFDVGIAEGHSVTFAGGLAWGKSTKVVCVIYATFLQRALDNLFHDVCLQQLPVLFAVDRAGLAGYGGTHQGIYDLSFLQTMPNLIIAQPRDGQLLLELAESAFSWGKPVAIRYPNLPASPPSTPLVLRTPGKGELLHRGEEVALISGGHMYSLSLEVAALLKNEGVDPTLVDPIFVKPLDEELLEEIALSHTLLVTIEEHSVCGGLGTAIGEFLLRKGIGSCRLLKIGVPDSFPPHGSRAELLSLTGLNAPAIADQIREIRGVLIR